MHASNLLGLHQLRIKIISLAEESRRIRREVQRVRKGSKWDYIRNSLHLHRVDDIRPESRAALLAYACARGVPYAKLEDRARSKEPDIAGIRRNLKRFGFDDTVLENWLKGVLDTQTV